MTNLIEQLGVAIVEARETAGFTQADLIAAVEPICGSVSGGTVSRWENGGNDGGVPFDKLVAVAEATGCTLHVELRQGPGTHRAVYRDGSDGRMANLLADVAEAVGSLDDAGLRRVLDGVKFTVHMIGTEKQATRIG